MRKLMWFTIGFVCACILGVFAWDSWLCWLFVVSSACFLVTLVAKRWIRFLRILTAFSLGLSIGIGWFAVYDSMFLQFPKEIDGKTASASMTISDYSTQTDYGMCADAEMNLDGRVYKLRVYLEKTEEEIELKPGDRIRGIFQFKSTLRGSAEEATYHSADGIYLLAYQDGEISIDVTDSVPVRYHPATWKKYILDRIDQLFSEETAGFAKALFMGERVDIDYETNTAFKVGGISHIIAVSGLHVSIILALLYFLMGKHTHWPTIIGIPLLLAFAAVVGFTPSITRACIMQIIMMIGWSLYEEYDSPTSLSAAVLIMLAINPMTITSVSFQLSVGCIIGMILFTKPIHDWMLSPKVLGPGKGRSLGRKLKRGVVASVSVTLSANIVTIPLVAYYFGTVSLVGIVTNLLTLWAVSLIFYGIIFACLGSLLFMKLGAIIAVPTGLLIQFVTGTAKHLSGFPYAAVYTQSYAVVIWLIICYVFLLIFLLWKNKRPSVLFGAIAISLAVSLFVSWYIPAQDRFSFTVLNVGQGQSVVLRCEDKTYLVDCGGDTEDGAADIAAEYLMSQGIFHLDGVIVTHYDSDHIGGIPLLLSRVDASELYMPIPTEEDADTAEQLGRSCGTYATYVQQNMTIAVGTGILEIIVPEENTSGNENGICVLFRADNCDILITGDRDIAGEKQLLQQVALPDLEILVAGHHGSKYSTSIELLEATTPEYVFVSAGKDNPYGHPSEELLERLSEFGCTVYCTADQGNIVFRRR